MFELIVKRLDGFTQLKEYFNTRESANKWISEEMTRPYWVSSHSFEVIDHNPVPPTQEEIDAKIAAETAKKSAMSALKTRLDSLDGQADLTAVELKESVRKIFKLLKAKGLLE